MNRNICVFTPFFLTTEDISQEETTITKRLSFSGERKSKKKNSVVNCVKALRLSL
jgi:hypothetical protein